MKDKFANDASSYGLCRYAASSSGAECDGIVGMLRSRAGPKSALASLVCTQLSEVKDVWFTSRTHRKHMHMHLGS